MKTQIQRTERVRGELVNGRIVHLERHNTAPGPVLEMVLALDAATYALLHDWDDLGTWQKKESVEYMTTVARAEVLAQCIAWTLGDYTLGEVKIMNVLRYERHRDEVD